jgi:hypothetical protein
MNVDNAKLKQDALLNLNQKLCELLAIPSEIKDWSDGSVQKWSDVCRLLADQIDKDIVRVAVIGAIKSGKSTFVNAFLKADHLKRGAGVVTSIVTKVRQGKKLTARLFFKSWDDVNRDIQQALVLFPSLNWQNENQPFDLRRQADREALGVELSTLDKNLLITKDTRNINGVLLTSYLQGFDTVKDIVSSENTTKTFVGADFETYKSFAGSETLAVYLNDVKIELDGAMPGEGFEIADCQGSDSPNPLHLAMIQDYLIKAHLVIYVISSRTGLRRADIRFLSMIKKMGIIDNALFVINCDFYEHESQADLENLIGRIKDELGLIIPDPDVYCFSALFNLFKARTKALSEKDLARLGQWEKDELLTQYSDLQTKRFLKEFKRQVTAEKTALLLKNHLEHLSRISDGIGHWIQLHQDILTKDKAAAVEMTAKIKHHQKQMDQIQTMVRSTLDGAVGKIRKELRREVDGFFDRRNGTVVDNIGSFVRGFDISYPEYAESLENTGFLNTLYLVYQAFKQAVDTYMTESVNPAVIKFIRIQEERIKTELNGVAGPYDGMIRDVLAEYKNTMAGFGISLHDDAFERDVGQDLKNAKQVLNLNIPPAAASMRYSANIKTDAVLRLGLFTVARIFKKILKKPLDTDGKEGPRALKAGVKRMKQETERNIDAHFKDYRENIKFQYLYLLIDAAANSLHESLQQRFQAYLSDLTNIVDLIHNKSVDKAQAADALESMATQSAKIHMLITDLRESISKNN